MFVTYHKMNKKLLLSGKQIQQIQPRLTPRGFSVELLHTDSAEGTGLELGIVIIKKRASFSVVSSEGCSFLVVFCLRAELLLNNHLHVLRTYANYYHTLTFGTKTY